MKTALVCIAKNERYATEWVAYYRKMGFDKIFMYQNNWRYAMEWDHFEKIPFDGDFMQKPAYMDFIKNRSHGFDWVAFFDLDEYLVLKKHRTIKDFLSGFHNVNGLAINLITYGANGQMKREGNDFSLIKQFTHRNAKKSDYVKLIIKLPTSGEMIDPHHWTIPMMGMQGELITGSLNPGGLIDTAVINHYAVKSYEDWCERCDRGYPFSRNKVSKYEEWEGKKHLDSEVEDLTAKNFLYGKN